MQQNRIFLISSWKSNQPIFLQCFQKDQKRTLGRNELQKANSKPYNIISLHVINKYIYDVCLRSMFTSTYVYKYVSWRDKLILWTMNRQAKIFLRVDII